MARPSRSSKRSRRSRLTRRGSSWRPLARASRSSSRTPSRAFNQFVGVAANRPRPRTHWAAAHRRQGATRVLGSGRAAATQVTEGADMEQGRHFGNRLREARLSAGLSQSELEELSGIPKARLSRYENGHVEPSIQTLNRLARALNVSEASLLGDQRAVLEEFFKILEQRGVRVSSPEQGAKLA